MGDGSRKLTVTSCEVTHQGTNKKGEPYTIYEVHAVGEDGLPVEESLRSFAELPIGELKTYTIQPYDHERYGRSYTLSLPKAGSRLGPKVDQLRKELDELTKRVDALEGGGADVA